MGAFEELDLLLREIQRRLDQHPQRQQLLGQHADLLGEDTLQGPGGRAGGLLGTRLDQVGHRFGLRQVHLVVEEGALGELAGPREPQAGVGTGFEHALQQHLHHDGAAVALQLEHGLAGVGMRRREKGQHRAIDWTLGGPQAGERGVPRLERRGTLRQRGCHIAGRGSADAHHADTTATRRSGYGDDGVGGGEHVLRCAGR